MISNRGKLLIGYTDATALIVSRFFFKFLLVAISAVNLFLARMGLVCLISCQMLAGEHFRLPFSKVASKAFVANLADGSAGKMIIFFRKVLLVRLSPRLEGFRAVLVRGDVPV